MKGKKKKERVAVEEGEREEGKEENGGNKMHAGEKDEEELVIKVLKSSFGMERKEEMRRFTEKNGGMK